MGDDDKKHHVANHRYHTFFPILFLSGVATIGVFILPMALMTSAYVGNNVMFTFSSYMIWDLAITLMLLVAWTASYAKTYSSLKHKYKHSRDDSLAIGFVNYKSTSEYKYNLTLWSSITTGIVVFKLIVWIFLVSRTTKWTGSFLLASPSVEIGAVGAQGTADDLFQVSALVISVLSFVGGYYFVKFNHGVYTHTKGSN